MKMIQALPLMSISVPSGLRPHSTAVPTMVTPRMMTDADATDSVDQREWAGCKSSAPAIAPAPKHPRRKPKPSGLPLAR